MVRLSVLFSCKVLLAIAFLVNDYHVHGQLITTGKKAIHRLMKGVYEVPTRSRYYKKCIKDGDEKKAIDDFLSLKPDKVKKSLSRAGEPVKDAYIGGIKFRLNVNDRTQYGRPTITIRNKNGELNIKIVYMHTPKVKE